jgi:hypothetical protein
MMVCTAPQLIHAGQVFAKVRGIPVQKVPPVMRKPNPAIVVRMQTATMGNIAMELRPVMAHVRMAHLSTALTMGNSAMALKAVMRKLMRA